MSKEKQDAQLQKASGTLKETIGKTIGNEKLQAEGAAEKFKGAAKEVVEDVKDTVEGIKKGVSDNEDK